MLLGIAAELSAPPSSPTSFREISLFAKVYRGYDVLALCLPGEEDFYVPWMRRYGLFDYIDDILPRDQIREFAVEVEGGRDARLTAHNIAHVLAML